MKTSIKILLTTLSFVLIALIGLSTVVIVLNMSQTLFVRVIIGVSGPIWAALTIGLVAFRTEYRKLFRKWHNERQYNRIVRTRPRYPEYFELYQKYPLAIRRWEQHCMHKNYSRAQMINLALQVSQEEWAEREAYRIERKQELESASQGSDRSNGSLV